MASRILHRGFWRYVVIAFTISSISSCGGGGGSVSSNSTSSAMLTVSANALNFGSVAIGSSKNQNGSLTAGGSDVVISSAGWNGQGYSLGGITFPVTVKAGSAVPFTVTFAPQASGTVNGQISFLSDASNSPSVVTLTGTGSGTQPHSVSLSWDASTSQVAGYNIYRSQSGGQYAKLNSVLITGVTFSDTAVQSGATYYYAATSVDSNNVESVYSNVASAVIP